MGYHSSGGGGEGETIHCVGHYVSVGYNGLVLCAGLVVELGWDVIGRVVYLSGYFFSNDFFFLSRAS